MADEGDGAGTRGGAPAASRGKPPAEQEERRMDDEKPRTQGTGAMGTQEREERITGSVGVKNRKGEVVNPGSTTSPKGGPGFGEPRQGAPTDEHPDASE